MSDLAAVDHVTLSDTVYRSVRRPDRRQFQPGERLKIRDLADQLGTSVTPVRRDPAFDDRRGTGVPLCA
jgi:DNA-binding GntR family transcriptional regulator